MEGRSFIPLRSYQSEMSHVLATVPVLVSREHALIKGVILVFVVFHVYRYTRHHKTAVAISCRQRRLWWLSIVDYAVIILHTVYAQHTVLLATLSGVLSFFFMHDAHRDAGGVDTERLDILVVLVLLAILAHTSHPYTRFFAIRDVVYHVLEFTSAEAQKSKIV